jgi:hypothetical protein
MLADLGVTKTHSRPHVSDDNPYVKGGGKQYESVLRLDVNRSLRLLIRFGLVPRSYKPEEKQPPSRSILSPV